MVVFAMGTSINKSKKKKIDVAVSDILPFFWSLGMADTDEIGTADLASGAVGAAVDVGRQCWRRWAPTNVAEDGRPVGQAARSGSRN